MWGKREFLESSSSEETINTISEQRLFESDFPKVENIKKVSKAPLVRPITANSRIMSIHRGKLLDRGNTSVRVETSPFFRQNNQELNDLPLPVNQKILNVYDDIEEIKITETKSFKIQNPVKQFLVPENSEKNGKSPEKPAENSEITEKIKSRKEIFNPEIAPQPRYQRIAIQVNKNIRPRPQSQQCGRSLSKEFKTVTTFALQKPVPPPAPPVLKKVSENKSNLFTPVPFGSKLYCLLKRNKEGLNKDFPKYSISQPSNGIQLMAALRHLGKNGGNYIISLTDKNFSKKSSSYLGKVVLDFHHKSMAIFGFGKSPKSLGKDETKIRKQYGEVLYVKTI